MEAAYQQWKAGKLAADADAAQGEQPSARPTGAALPSYQQAAEMARSQTQMPPQQHQPQSNGYHQEAPMPPQNQLQQQALPQEYQMHVPDRLPYQQQHRQADLAQKYAAKDYSRDPHARDWNDPSARELGSVAMQAQGMHVPQLPPAPIQAYPHGVSITQDPAFMNEMRHAG